MKRPMLACWVEACRRVFGGREVVKEFIFQRRTRVEPSRSTHFRAPSLSEKRRRVPCGTTLSNLEREAEVRLRLGSSFVLEVDGGWR